MGSVSYTHLTGAIMTREDLEPIAEIIKEKDLYVISDEIYAELTYGQEHCSIAVSYTHLWSSQTVINEE